MPHHWLNSLVASIAGEKRAIWKKRSCQLDQGESNYLPEDLVIESILTRLPVRDLLVRCQVSKLWYYSIHNDSNFAATHSIQNKDKVSLVFHVLNVSRGDSRSRIYLFSLLGREKVDIRKLFNLNTPNIYEIVGFCNGLACMRRVEAAVYTRGLITVVNQSRGESFVLSYLRPAAEYVFLCHGFGFDSLSQVYKAVMVFVSEAKKEFLCMVITLGTMSWRTIVTSAYDISTPQGSSVFPSWTATRVSRTLCRQGTFCGGDLFWRTRNRVSNVNEIEMLLSFDLHNEKIHFIRLPTECTPATERQYLAVVHLLEYRGYPCIAHSERITTRPDNDHCGHRCDFQGGVCCCCYEVHMYLLKDKEQQVWTREDTFDVQIPTPLCRLKTKKMPPTRILTFSDQVLLYWFNGTRLVLYNLQEKHLQTVVCSRYYPGVFQSKLNESRTRRIGDDDNIDCPSMDYQLHAQVENILSLETFIPKEAKTSECNSTAKLKDLFSNDLATGWLNSRRKPDTFYAFS